MLVSVVPVDGVKVNSKSNNYDAGSVVYERYDAGSVVYERYDAHQRRVRVQWDRCTTKWGKPASTSLAGESGSRSILAAAAST